VTLSGHGCTEALALAGLYLDGPGRCTGGPWSILCLNC